MLEALAQYTKSQLAAAGEADTVLQEVIGASVLLTRHLQKYNQQRLRVTFQARPSNAASATSPLAALSGAGSSPATAPTATPSDSTSTGGLEGVMNNSAFSIPTTENNTSSFEESKLSVSGNASSSGPGVFGTGELMQLTLQKHLAVPLELFLTTRSEIGSINHDEMLGRSGSASFSNLGDSPVPRSPAPQEELDGREGLDSPDLLSAFSSWMSLSGTGRTVDPWSFQIQNRVLAHVQHIVSHYVKTSEVFLPDYAARCALQQPPATAGNAQFADLQTLPNSSTNHLIDVPRNVLIRIWTSRREARKFHRAFRSLREAALEALLPPSFSTLYSMLVAYRGRLVSVTFLLPITSAHPNVLPESSTAPGSAPISIVGALEAAWRVSLGCLGLPGPTSGGGESQAPPTPSSGGGGGIFRRRVTAASAAVGEAPSPGASKEVKNLLTTPLPLFLGLDGRLYCLTLSHMVSSQSLGSSPATPASPSGYPFCTANTSPSSSCSSITSDVFRREDLCTQAAIRMLQRNSTGPSTPSSQQNSAAAGTPKQRGRNPVRAAAKAILTAEHSLLSAGVEVASTAGLSELLHAEGCNMSLLGQVLLQLFQHIKAGPEVAPGQAVKRQAAAAAQAAAQARSVLPIVFRRMLQSLLVLYINVMTADCARPPPSADCPHPSFATERDVVSCVEKLVAMLYASTGGGLLPLRTCANALSEDSAGVVALMQLAEHKYLVPSEVFLFSLRLASFPLLPVLQEALLLVGLLFDLSVEVIVPAVTPTFLCDSGRRQFQMGRYWTAQKTQVEVEVWGKALKVLQRKTSTQQQMPGSLRVDANPEGSRPTSPAARSPVRSPVARDLFDVPQMVPSNRALRRADASDSETTLDQCDLVETKSSKGPTSGTFSRNATCPALSALAISVPSQNSSSSGIFQVASSGGSSSNFPSDDADPAEAMLRFHYGKVARWAFAALTSTSRSARRHAYDALTEYSSVSPIGSGHFRDPTAFLATADVDEAGQPFYSAVEILKVEKKIAMEQTLMLRLALHFPEVVEDSSPPYRPDANRRGSTTRVGRRASTTISVNLCQMSLAGISAAMLQLLRIANFATTQSSTLPTRSATTIAELAKRHTDRSSRTDDYRSLGVTPLDTLLLAADVCVEVGNLLPLASSSVEDEIHFDVSATSAKLALSLLLTTDAEDFFSAASLQQPMNGWNLFKARVAKPLHVASFTSIVSMYADLVRRFGHQLSPTITLTVNHPFYARLLACKRAVMPFYEYIMENTFRVSDLPKYVELFRFLIRLSTPLDASLAKPAGGVALQGAKKGRGAVAVATDVAESTEDNSLLRSLLFWTLAYFSDFIRNDSLLDQGIEVLHLLWCVSRRSVVLYRIELALLCLVTNAYFQWRRIHYADNTPTGLTSSRREDPQASSQGDEWRGRFTAHLQEDDAAAAAQDMEADSLDVAELLSSPLHVIGLAQNYIRRHASVKHDARQREVERSDSFGSTAAGSGEFHGLNQTATESYISEDLLQDVPHGTTEVTATFLTPIDVVTSKLALLEGENANELLSLLHQHVSVAQTIRQLQRLTHHSASDDQQPELLFLEALRGQIEFTMTSRKEERWLLHAEEQSRGEIATVASFELDVLCNEHEINRKVLIAAAEAMKRLRSSMSSFALFGDDQQEGGMTRQISSIGVSGAFGNTSPVNESLGSPLFHPKRKSTLQGIASSTSFTGGFSRSSSSFAVDAQGKPLAGATAGTAPSKMYQLTTLILSTSAEADVLLHRLKLVQGMARGWTSMRIATARKALSDEEATFAMRERWGVMALPEKAAELSKYARNLTILNYHHREHLTDLRRCTALLSSRRISLKKALVPEEHEGGERDDERTQDLSLLRRALDCREILDAAHELFLRRASSDDVISNILYNTDHDGARLMLLVTMLVSAVHCTTISAFATLTVGESCIRRAGDVLLAQFKPLFLQFDAARAAQDLTMPPPRGRHAPHSLSGSVCVGDLSCPQMRELYIKLALFLQRCASHDIVKLGSAAGDKGPSPQLTVQQHRQKLLQLLRGVEPVTVGSSSIGVAVAIALLLAEQVIGETGLKHCCPSEHDKLLRMVHLACASFAGSDDDREDLRREMLTIPTDCVNDLDATRSFLAAIIEFAENKTSPLSGPSSSERRHSKELGDNADADKRRRSSVFAKPAQADPPARKQRGSLFSKGPSDAVMLISTTLAGKPIPHEVTTLLSRCILAIEGYVPALIRDVEVAETAARNVVKREEQFAFVALLQSTIGLLAHDQQLLLAETTEPMHRQLISDEAMRMWVIIEADFEAEYEVVLSQEWRRFEAAEIQHAEQDGLRRLLLFQQSDREEIEREEVWERDRLEWASCRPKQRSVASTTAASSSGSGSWARTVAALSHREETQRETLYADESRHFLAIRDCFAIDERNMLLYFDTEKRNELFAVGYDGDVQEQLDDETQLSDALAALRRQDSNSSNTGVLRNRVHMLIVKLLGQLTTREMVLRANLSHEEESLRVSIDALMQRTRRSDAILAYDFHLERLKRAISSLEDEEIIDRRRVERSREAHHAQLCREVEPMVLAHCLRSERCAMERELRPCRALDALLEAEGAGRAAVDHEFRQSARLLVEMSHRSVALLSASQPIEWQTLIAQQHALMQDEEAARRLLDEEEEETFFRQSVNFEASMNRDDADAANEGLAATWWKHEHNQGLYRGGSNSSNSSECPHGTKQQPTRHGSSGLTAAALEQHQSLLLRANAVAAVTTAGTLTPRPPALHVTQPPPGASRSVSQMRTPHDMPGFASSTTRAAITAKETAAPGNAGGRLLAARLGVSPVAVSLAFNPGEELSSLLPLPPRDATDEGTRAGVASSVSPFLPRISLEQGSRAPSQLPLPQPPQRFAADSRASLPYIPGTNPSRQHISKNLGYSQNASAGRPVAPAVLTPIELAEHEESVERSIVDDERLAAWTVMALAWSRTMIEARLHQDQGGKLSRFPRR